MPRVARLLLSAFLIASLTPSIVRADRRYFVRSYTPYLAPAGTLELELWTTALSGQGDSTNTAWKNRAEFEYAITDRLTGAAYLNFVQSGAEESALRFDGPSWELIYRLAERGRLAVDPAAYLEVRANGNEVEIEPKLLLARRDHRLVSVVNVIGEFELLQGLSTEKNLELTCGLSHEFGPVVALGVEARYRRAFEEAGEDPTLFAVGPTLNLQTAKIQVSIGWQPQISGSPATSGGLNVSDFARSELRFLLGVDL